MQFVITVDSTKEKAVVQILENLRNLGVIEQITPLREGATPTSPEKDKTSREVASQYRDLVD